ncbi:unnamed protein product, partial [Iphiclides podalirius]
MQIALWQYIGNGIGLGYGPTIATEYELGCGPAIAADVPYGPGLAPGLGYGYGLAGPGVFTAPTAYAAGPAYGGAGIGDVAVGGEMPVTGTTLLAGQVPILGAVQFGGEVPAGGIVSIAGRCHVGSQDLHLEHYCGPVYYHGLAERGYSPPRCISNIVDMTADKERFHPIWVTRTFRSVSHA